MAKFRANAVYRVKGAEGPYKYCIAATYASPSNYIADCFPCDAQGNIDPEQSACAVPFHINELSGPVGRALQPVENTRTGGWSRSSEPVGRRAAIKLWGRA